MTRYAPFVVASALLGCQPDDSIADAATIDTSSATAPIEPILGAIVRGTLFTDDLAEAQATHDAVAAGGEPIAVQLGDLSHDVLLGTDLLDSVPNRFLAVDRWDSEEGMQGFFSDPEVAAGFEALFSGAPDIELFAERDDWYGWGSLDTAAGSERWFALVQGRLAAEPEEAQAVHDGVAEGGRAAAEPAGDVAHRVFLGLEDPRNFLAIDVWTSPDAIEAVYLDPAFGEAFGQVFDGPPTIEVYASTDWHQW